MTATPTERRPAAAPLSVRAITPEEHLGFLDSPLGVERGASFLQTPAWGAVKSEWRHESLGWYDATGALVGVGLVLYRQVPRLRRYLAYLPEGPVLDWADDHLDGWLDPLTRHLRSQGAFGIRLGPPVLVRSWTAGQVKAGIADPAVERLGDLPPAERYPDGAHVVAQLERLGWRRQGTVGGFSAGQPAYNFWIPLAGETTPGEGPEPLTEQQVLAGMNQLWRRNIKKADKAGVDVSLGGRTDLKAFHDLYLHTAERDRFTPRPLGYFEAMYDALTAERPDRIALHLAHHEGDLVAATLAIRVGRHVWYSYGASSTAKREVRGSNAVQWAMIRAALAAGAEVYDLRGITDTLDPEDPHVGLIQFKVGTGGRAVEYAGEWDLPLNRPLYTAFRLYMARRS